MPTDHFCCNPQCELRLRSLIFSPEYMTSGPHKSVKPQPQDSSAKANDNGSPLGTVLHHYTAQTMPFCALLYQDQSCAIDLLILSDDNGTK